MQLKLEQLPFSERFSPELLRVSRQAPAILRPSSSELVFHVRDPESGQKCIATCPESIIFALSLLFSLGLAAKLHFPMHCIKHRRICNIFLGSSGTPKPYNYERACTCCQKRFPSSCYYPVFLSFVHFRRVGSSFFRHMVSTFMQVS